MFWERELVTFVGNKTSSTLLHFTEASSTSTPIVRLGKHFFSTRSIYGQEMGGKRSDEQKIEFIFQSLLTDGHCPAGRRVIASGNALSRRDDEWWHQYLNRYCIFLTKSFPRSFFLLIESNSNKRSNGRFMFGVLGWVYLRLYFIFCVIRIH